MLMRPAHAKKIVEVKEEEGVAVVFKYRYAMMQVIHSRI